jgi:hypothetical protein
VATPTLTQLLDEYERALAYTTELVSDLSPDEIVWRPDEQSSAIGWHLGHQPAVAHFMVRNLTAAEPRIDAELEMLMDSATAEPERGALPELDRLFDYRSAVAERVRFRVGQIDDGRVGAPSQLRLVAGTLMTALINHEYQHDQWIGEVCTDAHGRSLPPRPSSDLLADVDGYLVVRPS